MEIFENKKLWQENYNNGLIAHYNQTNEMDWKQYPRPKNTIPISGKAVDLSSSRLLFISSAGGYLASEQQPFNTESKLGDYSIRSFPSQTPFDQISYAHTHYDHTALDEDPQVLMPLSHLQKLVDDKIIGELAPSMVSFMGYQPDIASVVDETIPAILKIAHDEQIQAALLIPA